MKIYEKLSQVQNELKAPKNQKNTFGNYKYRSCEDILEALKPILKKNKLTLVLSDELVNIGDRYYIKAMATIYDLEEEGSLVNTAYAREEETKKGMDGSQITGTASSYARKYALNGLFNIDDTKDADIDEYTKRTKEEPTSDKEDMKMPIQEGQKQIIAKLKPEALKKLLDEKYKVESIDDLTWNQAREIEIMINNKLNKDTKVDEEKLNKVLGGTNE